jgi:TonB family protein
MLFCWGAPVLVGAQDGALHGVVRDSAGRIGIAGAEVRVGGTEWRALTDERGAFRFAAGTGGSMLRVRRLGYAPVQRALGARVGDSLIEIRLVPVVQPLAPLVVRATRTRYSGRLAGYYERLERRSIGQFITRADLERERPNQLTDMIQRAPGVNLVRGRPGMLHVRMRGRDCSPLIWVDGAALSLGDIDLDAFSPASLEGIELYLGASSAPQRYQGTHGKNECGTILLWSRGPDTEPKARGSDVHPDELERLVAELSVFTADQVDSAAVLDGANTPVAIYPPSLRAAGVGGVVLMEFVVDTAGRVEGDRFGIVSSTHALFSEAVWQAVREVTFRPAMRGGRRVRQLVRLPFEFVPGQDDR